MGNRKYEHRDTPFRPNLLSPDTPAGADRERYEARVRQAFRAGLEAFAREFEQFDQTTQDSKLTPGLGTVLERMAVVHHAPTARTISELVQAVGQFVKGK